MLSAAPKRRLVRDILKEGQSCHKTGMATTIIQPLLCLGYMPVLLLGLIFRSPRVRGSASVLHILCLVDLEAVLSTGQRLDLTISGCISPGSTLLRRPSMVSRFQILRNWSIEFEPLSVVAVKCVAG